MTPRSSPAIPLVQQIEAVRFAVVRQHSLMQGAKIRELRPATIAEHSLSCLEAAVRTLDTLAINADEIRAFLKLPAATRQALVRPAPLTEPHAPIEDAGVQA